MSACYPESVVAYAKSQKGTKEGNNNWNPYAKELDAINYFKPQKKQNLPWCCIYVDDCIYHGCDKDKAKTYAVLYQPSYDNLSAVVKYLAGYFKEHNAYFTDKNKVEIGDVVFFNSVDSKGKVTSKYAHTGIVIDRDERGITTSEGNRNNKVSECQYLFTSIGTKIEGFGKPKYDKKPEPDPMPIPTPEPIVVPTEKKYRVTGIKTFLAIRSTPVVAPNDANKVGELKNGAIVTVYEKNGGWARITGNCWVSMSYLKEV